MISTLTKKEAAFLKWAFIVPEHIELTDEEIAKQSELLNQMCTEVLRLREANQANQIGLGQALDFAESFAKQYKPAVNVEEDFSDEDLEAYLNLSPEDQEAADLAMPDHKETVDNGPLKGISEASIIDLATDVYKKGRAKRAGANWDFEFGEFDIKEKDLSEYMHDELV